MSASRMPTFKPLACRPSARLAATVDLPTPPFPDATAISDLTPGTGATVRAVPSAAAPPLAAPGPPLAAARAWRTRELSGRVLADAAPETGLETGLAPEPAAGAALAATVPRAASAVSTTVTPPTPGTLATTLSAA